MMPRWVSLLFLCVIPGFAAGGLGVLAQKYQLVEKIMISVGACGLSFGGFLVSVGVVIISLGGTRADGVPTRGALIAGWGTSAILALVCAGLVYLSDLPDWLASGFFWAGCFISALGISFLIMSLLGSGPLKNKSTGKT